ncbi:hypothetical protein FHW69_002713 [Luteibacter sp. Sphag1AF]|uniref:hypothetical protein n=1 Tax=Luteibacter sp. Sphag1AF TaxID=2587031 RepID=UPI00160BB4F2|nr:hypothetical protein [Luteibacter sp. Sphag1AF]MBB3228078.1 hypothetical protein [Luteibacter sp. Sphag1AF]
MKGPGSRAWKSFKVRATPDGSPEVRVTHTSIQQRRYEAFKRQANITRNSRGFGARKEFVFFHGKRAISKAFVSGTLRRRPTNAPRQSLKNIGVLNPAHSHGAMLTHKSHLLPDTFGGPNSPNNLINEHRNVNLRAHKRIENRIGSQLDTHFPTATPLVRRGSLVIVDSFHPNGRPQSREYQVHTYASPSGVTPAHPDRYDRFTVNHK